MIRQLPFKPLSLIAFVLHFMVLHSAFAQEKAVSHTIKQGETLSAIARKYKTTTAEIIKLNPDAAKGIRAGAVLQIPSADRPEPKTSVSEPTKTEKQSENGGKKHLVQSGESLFKIAKKYGVSVKDLESWNNMRNQDLKSGQEIWVSKPESDLAEQQKPSRETSEPEKEKTANSQLHEVQKGETLSLISRKYGVSVADLKKANNLKSDQVALGQQLSIPVSAVMALPKTEPSKSAEPVQKAVQAKVETPAVVETPKSPEKAPVAQSEKPGVQGNGNNGSTPSQVEKPVEKEIVSKEPAKPTEGSLREVNNVLGYTRIVETGFAEAIEGDVNSKKHLCLHKTAPIGAILQVKNETNGQTVFVKVVGKLPDTGSNEKLIIRISRQAYDKLLAVGKRFPVEVSYPESQP